MKFNKVLDQYNRNSRYTTKCQMCGENFETIGYENKICKKCESDFNKNMEEMSKKSEDKVAKEKEKFTIDFRR